MDKKKDGYKSVPRPLVDMSQDQLDGLINLFKQEGSRHMVEFAKICYENNKEIFVSRVPAQSEMNSMWGWGYYQGVIDTYRMLANFPPLLEAEQKNRKLDKEKVAKKKAN